MSKEFIPYQEALELKELGFNESCFGKYDVYGVFDHILFYHNHDVETEYVGCSAPLYQQAFKWFREKFDLRIWIESNYGVAKFEYVIATTNPNFINKQFNDFSGYKTYEKAELACLKKLIEIVKNK